MTEVLTGPFDFVWLDIDGNRWSFGPNKIIPADTWPSEVLYADGELGIRFDVPEEDYRVLLLRVAVLGLNNHHRYTYARCVTMLDAIDAGAPYEWAESFSQD